MLFAAPVIAQLVERETVVGCYTVISRSAVRLRLAGGVLLFELSYGRKHNQIINIAHTSEDINIILGKIVSCEGSNFT